jgi:predicted nucleic acid-binding protein
MKAYLDNNIVSAIAKDDHPAESEALDRLLKAKDEGKVDLVTSELTLEEIKKYQGPTQPRVERVFRLLEKVPIVQWDQLVGMHSYGDPRTWINTPIIENDPDYSALLALGLEMIDARHIFVASKQACDTFVTCDKGILQRATGIRTLFPLDVQKPSDLVANQGW